MLRLLGRLKRLWQCGQLCFFSSPAGGAAPGQGVERVGMRLAPAAPLDLSDPSATEGASVPPSSPDARDGAAR